MFVVVYCCAAFPKQPVIQILDKLFLRSDIECESLWLLAHYKIFLLFYPKPYSQFKQMDLLKRKWTQFVVMSGRSVVLTTLFLGRLSGHTHMCPSSISGRGERP